jgi:hypothetical protein
LLIIGSMHHFKALFLSVAAIASICVLSLPAAFAQILLDDVMSDEEQHRTGVFYLNHNQRAELETWLNDNFVLKTQQQPKQAPQELTLAENINNGHQLRLSDGSLYEIAPSDVTRAAGWITPFPIQVVPSGDPNYPFKIVNTNTGNSLKAKLLTAPNS